ncbi:hypothetical protein B5S29_g5701 [[Candida] boidinii]|nr:hypothetical protein B5S29_g5701 [[Candida] boidinii]
MTTISGRIARRGSRMLNCTYCKSSNHAYADCPLVPKCKICDAGNTKQVGTHNFLSCPKQFINDKMTQVKLLSGSTIQQALQRKNPLQQIPQDLLIHPEFPTQYLSLPQVSQYVTKPLEDLKKREQAAAERKDQFSPPEETQQIAEGEWKIQKSKRSNKTSNAKSTNLSNHNQKNSFEVLDQEKSEKEIITQEQTSSPEARENTSSSEEVSDCDGEEADARYERELDHFLDDDQEMVSAEINDTQLTNVGDSGISQPSTNQSITEMPPVDEDQDMSHGDTSADEKVSTIRKD